MSAECTVEQHCAELIYFTRIARAEGRQEGILIGHEAAWYEAYATGYGDCAEKAGIVVTPAGVRRREAT